VNCTSCGSDNRPGAKFCAECGQPLSAACPDCGSAIDLAAKFCAECGSRVQPGASAGLASSAGLAAPVINPVGSAAPTTERRVVSVLFADLVDFTRLAEGRDPEAVREILSGYFDMAGEVIGRYGGTIEKFIGDAVMAVWGAPVAHEDDAERAVRAALDLIGSIRALGRDANADLRLRAGVLTGEAAVTLGATNQGLVAGDLVNTASRLQSVAAPETVLVGEETRRATAGAIAYEPAGEAVLKGKSAPVAAFRALRVVGKIRGIGRSEALEPPFVGRETEFRLLREMFHATGRDRKARLVSLSGQAGIGKSRLSWEFNKYIDGVVEPVWWHHGRSPAYGEGISFWALGEMVRKRAGLAEGDDETATRVGVTAALATHVPDPADRAFIEPCLLALLGVEDAPPGGRDRLFAGWRTFFERIAESGTVALVFEDLHWADDGLLDFVEHLLEWSRNHPILILTLARPELLDRRPTWGGARASTSLALGPLADAEMRALLAGLVPGLPESAVVSILQRANGIPLYAVETVRMLVADGRLEERDFAYVPVGDLGTVEVPSSLRALVAARLDSLDPDARTLVQDASVLGQTFSTEALQAISGIDRPILEPRLRDLVRREIFELDTDPRSPERGQYGFVQALLREVAYDTLALRDRRARHLAAAEFFGAQDDEELAGALATHFMAAYRAGAAGPEAEPIAVQARVALRAAADRAAALGAPLQAISHLREAVFVTSDDAEAGSLLERAGRIAEPSGRHADAVELLTAAEERFLLAGLTGDAARARANRAFAQTSVASANEAAETIAPLLERFDELAAEPAIAAEVAARAASINARRGSERLALEWADRALEIAEAHGLIHIVVDALASKGTMLVTAGRNIESGVLLAGAARLAHQSGAFDAELRARALLVNTLLDDDPRGAVVESRDAAAVARGLGRSAWTVLLNGTAAEAALLAGDWPKARQWLDEPLTVDPEARELVITHALRAMHAALAGDDPRAALAALEELRAAGVGQADASMTFYYDATAGYLAWLAGDHRVAHDVAVACSAADPLNEYYLRERGARAALWLGDVRLARAQIELLRALGYRGRANGTSLDTVEAGLAALEGRRGHAIPAYGDATAAWRELGCDGGLALALLDMVQLLGIDTSEGRDAAAELRPLLERLGGRALLAILEGLEAAAPTLA
jgi:class 3 adenylate cyclase/tetratricopeptide (TPR) repeat protein